MQYPLNAPMLTPAEMQKFEAPLIALANLAGGDLRKLLHAFFSFLHRRTDFYCIMPNEEGNIGGGMGFREGQAEQILLASFRQFPLRKIGPRTSNVGSSCKSSAEAAGAPTASNVSAAASSASIVRTAGDQSVVDKELTNASSAIKAEKPAPVSEIKQIIEGERGIEGDASSTTKPASKETSRKKEHHKIRYTEEGKQIPIGNGGSTSRYVWTQTLDEVTVHIPLPEGIRAKDLDVDIGSNSISIRQKGGESSSSGSDGLLSPILGTLFGRIRPSESTWTLETTTSPGHPTQQISTLQLILDKAIKTWWEAVISGDNPVIDTTMVDSTRHIGTYDEETQAEIRRIMFDQRQERLGLPTSQQIMFEDLPALPSGEKLKGAALLPSGVEYIDSETLESASLKGRK
jgi:hypothetical protein